ncbi:uncharacterized protein LOC134208923 [Armigeres subalbatus]|uniref:uncharacterized protein LOC134208923 n=1 Tax=Armigeres subalbatus TaxID=124917 RepID=UPI002ED37FF2
MKHLLTLTCVLGFLCGGIFADYAAINVGAQGLLTIATSLKNISPVMTAFYKNLNSALTKFTTATSKVESLVNSTYQTLNDTYGATQTNLENVFSNINNLDWQITYVLQQFSSNAGYDVYLLENQLQQTFDQLLSYYGMLSNEVNYDTCSLEIFDDAVASPNQLVKFGTSCLQTYVDTIPTLVSPVQDILDLVKSDFKSFSKQLNICASTSTNCINAYFDNIGSELSYISNEVYVVQYLLNIFQDAAKDRDNLCGQLIKYNVQDILNGLFNQFVQCM